jgi:hypothetical protein
MLCTTAGHLLIGHLQSVRSSVASCLPQHVSDTAACHCLQVGLDTSGAQNRVGSAFFALCLLAFTSITSVDLVQAERQVGGLAVCWLANLGRVVWVVMYEVLVWDAAGGRVQLGCLLACSSGLLSAAHW